MALGYNSLESYGCWKSLFSEAFTSAFCVILQFATRWTGLCIHLPHPLFQIHYDVWRRVLRNIQYLRTSRSVSKLVQNEPACAPFCSSKKMIEYKILPVLSLEITSVDILHRALS
jgi:hypothetical protein